MGIIYGLIVVLFALVLVLFILVLKYRDDVDFLKSMYKINNDYVKSCEQDWIECIKRSREICDNVSCLLKERSENDGNFL